MKQLFYIACFSLLALSCPSFAEAHAEDLNIDMEMEEVTAENMSEVIAQLDTLAEQLQQQMKGVDELNEESD